MPSLANNSIVLKVCACRKLCTSKGGRSSFVTCSASTPSNASRTNATTARPERDSLTVMAKGGEMEAHSSARHELSVLIRRNKSILVLACSKRGVDVKPIVAGWTADRTGKIDELVCAELLLRFARLPARSDPRSNERVFIAFHVTPTFAIRRFPRMDLDRVDRWGERIV